MGKSGVGGKTRISPPWSMAVCDAPIGEASSEMLPCVAVEILESAAGTREGKLGLGCSQHIKYLDVFRRWLMSLCSGIAWGVLHLLYTEEQKNKAQSSELGGFLCNRWKKQQCKIPFYFSTICAKETGVFSTLCSFPEPPKCYFSSLYRKYCQVLACSGNGAKVLLLSSLRALMLPWETLLGIVGIFTSEAAGCIAITTLSYFLSASKNCLQLSQTKLPKAGGSLIRLKHFSPL